jgi:TfoX/Sxy family transcriptional regulator of competence genes
MTGTDARPTPTGAAMAHDEHLAARVRETLEDRTDVTSKRMFGSLAFLVGGHLACCVRDDGLLVRLPPEDAAAALAETGTRPFVMSGRHARGWVVVDLDGVTDPAGLRRWVGRGIDSASALAPR